MSEMHIINCKAGQPRAHILWLAVLLKVNAWRVFKPVKNFSVQHNGRRLTLTHTNLSHRVILLSIDDHADHSFLLFISNFSPSKDVPRTRGLMQVYVVSRLKLVCTHKDRNILIYIYTNILRFIKLCVRLLLLNISQSLWSSVHALHFHSHS